MPTPSFDPIPAPDPRLTPMENATNLTHILLARTHWNMALVGGKAISQLNDKLMTLCQSDSVDMTVFTHGELRALRDTALLGLLTATISLPNKEVQSYGHDDPTRP